jgi:ketosteroid isomerase-like protein
VSQENVEIVRRFIAAWSAHDREEMLRYLHPDAVFHSAITNVVGETFEGPDQIVAVFDRWDQEWSEIYWEVDEYIDVDESTVVTLHRVFATGRTSGIQTIRELGGVLELRDGLVVRQWIYLDPAEALAAAGVER